MKFLLAILMMFTVIATDFGSDGFNMESGCVYQMGTSVSETPLHHSDDCSETSGHHHCAHDSHVKFTNSSNQVLMNMDMPTLLLGRYSFLYANPFAKLFKRPPVAV